MENFNNQPELQIEAIEGRLEFGFWAKVWDGIKWVWEHLSISGQGGF